MVCLVVKKFLVIVFFSLLEEWLVIEWILLIGFDVLLVVIKIFIIKMFF